MYSPELQERAERRVLERRKEHGSLRAFPTRTISSKAHAWTLLVNSTSSFFNKQPANFFIILRIT